MGRVEVSALSEAELDIIFRSRHVVGAYPHPARASWDTCTQYIVRCACGRWSSEPYALGEPDTAGAWRGHAQHWADELAAEREARRPGGRTESAADPVWPVKVRRRVVSTMEVLRRERRPGRNRGSRNAVGS